MKTIEIKNRWTGAVIYAMQVADDDRYPIRTALEKAVTDGVNLSDADLTNANLSGADLTYANLAGIYLCSANLVGAFFVCADLFGADLSNANLSGADLFGADLTNANLSGADLSGVNLCGVRYVDVPVVPRLDAQILERIESGEGSLRMNVWHTCETTHCRAGWAVVLAGDAGRKLEAKIGTAAAGALIYHRSTGRVPDFYASDEDALADIVACAHDQGGAQ
jgi:hypothetical protein